jgi:hypothetical protein
MILQYFNKLTQATKILKAQQQESLLPSSGQPKNILQDVKTGWGSTYCILKWLLFLQEAIYHAIINNPKEANPVTFEAQEWKMYYQIVITLKTMGFWQCVPEEENYVTGSLVPVANYIFWQSFLQFITSQATKQVAKQLTRILLSNFGW